MIYDFPETNSPISQGDIFFGVPIVDLPGDEVAILNEDEKAAPDEQVLVIPWEEFAVLEKPVTVVAAMRPTIAIVGSQQCDALRAPNITLFEVRPFREIERKSKDTTKPAKWVAMLTQHARVNQKWFYLPPDAKVGFSDKMGVDFLTPIKVPRLALERLIHFRKGRLNEVASQHFRERLGEFFRRYAYDEWYALTNEELKEYTKDHPDTIPFPWQSGTNDLAMVRKENPPVEIEVEEKRLEAGKDHPDLLEKDEKGIIDFLVEFVESGKDLERIVTRIGDDLNSFTSMINKENEDIDFLVNNKKDVQDYHKQLEKVATRGSIKINHYSNQIQTLLPEYEITIDRFEASISGYISCLDAASDSGKKELESSYETLDSIFNAVKDAIKYLKEFRNSAVALSKNKVHSKLTVSAKRLAAILDEMIRVFTKVEALCINVQYTIFGKQPPDELPM